MDMGGRLYHADAHSPILQQTHFTSGARSQKVYVGVNMDGL